MANINWWDSDRGKRRPIMAEPAPAPIPEPAPTPAAAPAPAAPVQNTPVIQPFVVVPYSTPMQPLIHNSDGTLPIGDIDSDYIRANGGFQCDPMMGMQPMQPMMGGMPGTGMSGMSATGDDVFFDADEESKKITKKSAKRARRERGGKRVSAAKIIVILLLALFGTVSLFLEPLLSLFIKSPNVAFVTSGEKQVTLFGSFETVIGFFTGGSFDFGAIFGDMLLLTQCALVLGSVFFAILLLISIFSLRRGMPVIAKIFAFLGFALVVAALVIGIIKFEIGFGAYALTGIALLIFIVSLFGRRNKNRMRSRKRRGGRR